MAAPSRASRLPIDAGWALRPAGALTVLTANNLAAIPWLLHGFSTRAGGTSALSKSRVLNLGYTNWDSRATVLRNRGKFLEALQTQATPLATLRQVHSDIVRVVTGSAAEPLQGDAMIAQQADIVLGVQTADCVPILLVDTRLRAIAAVHAGWRGTLARIAAKAVGRMRLEFGTNPADIIAALGPSIGRCCYEVGSEVAQAFSGQFAGAADWFDGPFERLSVAESPDFLPWLTMMPPGHAPPPERVQLDLRAANCWQLVDAGVRRRNIAGSTLCTACRTDLFFSYRREGPQTGRMLAAIGLRPPTK